MSYKPELLVTAASLEEISLLIEAGADAFVIGESRFGMRLPGEFSMDQIRAAKEIAGHKQVKIYVAVNNIMNNEVLESLDQYLKGLSDIGVDGLVFGDPSVVMAVRRLELQIPLHWNTEMTSTNYATANYWGKRGASRYVMARELNMEQIIDTREHTELQLQVQVHGMTNMYHSKRSLVQSYMDHQQTDNRIEDTSASRGLFLTEAERPGETYPIYEDSNGTHIMSSDDICMLETLNELMEVKIDSFKIEGLMKSPEYNAAVVNAYRKVIDTYLADPVNYQFEDEWLEPIKALQGENRELSFGFFFKEQVY